MKTKYFSAALLLALTIAAPTAGAANLSEAEAQETAAVTAPAKDAAAETGAAPAEAEKAEEDWKLLLVNPWNTLPEDFSVELVTLASCGLKVDKRIFKDLEEMLVACREAGLRPLICSAYRTEAVQTRLYNNKIARLRAAGYGRESAAKEAGRWVAVPNTSEHQTGLALDIVSAGYQGLTKRQERTAEQQWLMEHCWEYGFILRYPSEKSEITGIGYEPWHYRYVGRETALVMRDSGQCLEEYLEAQEAQKTQEKSAPARSD